MADNIGGFQKKVVWIPIVYLLLFSVLLLIVWPQLDKSAIVAIVSVLGAGLAGVVGSFIGAIIALQRVEKESEIKIKESASSQALELTKLGIELRQEEGRQKQLLAVAKIYREFYKTLFELYETKTWPRAIMEQGLLNICEFSSANQRPKLDDKMKDRRHSVIVKSPLVIRVDSAARHAIGARDAIE